MQYKPACLQKYLHGRALLIPVFPLGGHFGRIVSPRINTIASRVQFKPLRIGENLVVNYNNQRGQRSGQFKTSQHNIKCPSYRALMYVMFSWKPGSKFSVDFGQRQHAIVVNYVVRHCFISSSTFTLLRPLRGRSCTLP